MKEIRSSDHAKAKLEVLAKHGVIVSTEFIEATVRMPDKLEINEDGKFTAQKRLNEKLVLGVVYREFAEFILLITLYPGRRSRYEKDSL